MATQKIISSKNIRPKLPIHLTITMLLVIKVFNPSDLAKGILYTISGIVWGIIIYLIIANSYEEKDVFEEIEKSADDTFQKAKNLL